MSSEVATTPLSTPTSSPPPRRGKRDRRRIKASAYTTLCARGEPMIWLTGGALAVSLLMVIGLLGLVIYEGIGTFWPRPIVRVQMVDGQVYMGELARSETYRPEERSFSALPKASQQHARDGVAKTGGDATRRLLRVGNFELTQAPFRWIDDFAAGKEDKPQWALVLERLENGRFYGELQAMLVDGKVEAATPEDAWKKFNEIQPGVRSRWREEVALKKDDLGKIAREQKKAELDRKQAELDYGLESAEVKAAEQEIARVTKWATVESKLIRDKADKLAAENARYKLRLKPVQGEAHDIPAVTIVRAYPANQLGLGDKVGIYFSRWGEFLLDDPRDANTAGGYFPAIWGTIAMTLIMTIIVVPFGVLAALYLREYAKAGPITSAVRIAINNLAGVPSVVFGAFGLGFFCYGVGGYIDGGPESPWPSGLWFAVLAGIGVIGVVAFLIGIAGFTTTDRIATVRSIRLKRLAMLLWLVSLGLIVLLIAKTPFFHGFYRASLMDNDPTFNKGGLLWASLTLALLTAPVVIVATEEALAAVPNSMREGSYACGASKWQTIRRIVLPRALPGILTGMILAMARGAGEVAPLMLVGVKKSTPVLPLDSTIPFVHLDRSFMHLAYMIYDVGFQSPDSEAARPMLFTATLLLIAIVACANLTAIWLRKRLRRKFVNAQF